MSATYDDARYGVEKILTFPSVTITNTGKVAQIIVPTEVLVTELGYCVSTLLTGSTFTLYLSSNAVTAGTISAVVCLSGVAVGTLQTSAAVTMTVSNGTTLMIGAANSSAGSGAINVFVKYRSKYV